MYAYCDPTGEALTVTALWIITFAVVGVYTGIVGGWHYAKHVKNLSPDDGWAYWKYVSAGASWGLLIGTLAGWGVGALITHGGTATVGSAGIKTSYEMLSGNNSSLEKIIDIMKSEEKAPNGKNIISSRIDER